MRIGEPFEYVQSGKQAPAVPDMTRFHSGRTVSTITIGSRRWKGGVANQRVHGMRREPIGTQCRSG